MESIGDYYKGMDKAFDHLENILEELEYFAFMCRYGICCD